jgi:hypothetical protein
MCGSGDGYRLHEGSTYRWWNMQCIACCRIVDECQSDRRTQLGFALPKVWPSAHHAWNEAAKHAQELRAALQEVDMLAGRDDAITEWRDKWAHLWPAPNVANVRRAKAQP